jgi:hypothetical protein
LEVLAAAARFGPRIRGKTEVFAKIAGDGSDMRKVEPRGIEPLTDDSEPTILKALASTVSKSLAPSLACDLQIDPELLPLVDAWPTLPAALRSGILAMIDATRK